MKNKSKYTINILETGQFPPTVVSDLYPRKNYKELVDKATPKKPIKIKTDYMEANVCPICLQVFEGFPYCRNCGQAFVTKEEN